MHDKTQLSGTVLIAEDHPPTAHLLELAFEKTAPGIQTEVVETGQAAIDRLGRVSKGATRPNLVILDLDLPVKSGYEVLEWRKNTDNVGRIPVVVVSGRTANTAMNKCYDLNAQSYIPKPEDWDGFIELVDVIVEYWFRHVNNSSPPPGSKAVASELEST